MYKKFLKKNYIVRQGKFINSVWNTKFLIYSNNFKIRTKLLKKNGWKTSIFFDKIFSKHLYDLSSSILSMLPVRNFIKITNQFFLYNVIQSQKICNPFINNNLCFFLEIVLMTKSLNILYPAIYYWKYKKFSFKKKFFLKKKYIENLKQFVYLVFI